MRCHRLALPIAFAAAVVACSSPAPPPDDMPVIAATNHGAAVPANPTLGSAQWYAWVNRNLDIDPRGGPEPGSPAWNREVQRKLGQEAPQAKPGSPQWQQAVDALLRTRAPAAQPPPSP